MNIKRLLLNVISITMLTIYMNCPKCECTKVNPELKKYNTYTSIDVKIPLGIEDKENKDSKAKDDKFIIKDKKLETKESDKKTKKPYLRRHSSQRNRIMKMAFQDLWNRIFGKDN